MSGLEGSSQVWRAEHLRLAVEAAQVALWSWDVETNRFTMDGAAFELWGLPWAEGVAFEMLSERTHPLDRDRVRAEFEATMMAEGVFEIDFRIMHDEEVRWVSARGLGGESEEAGRTMFGVFLDVTGRKQAEESSDLLAGEMSHRVKNLLSIAVGLTTMTSRSASDAHDMAEQLTKRLMALGRAHDLVRPQPGQQGQAALLGDLLTVVLSPYEEPESPMNRIRVAVARIAVGEAAATTLAMFIHELATNSVKHGALSSENGLIDVSTVVEDDVVILKWTESGGPEIRGAPTLDGFGSRMIGRSVTYQFGGTLDYDWQPTGLILTLRMKKDRLAL
jgi:PAS domain S-box-containing protein